ncbi:fructosamine kinase family protein [Waterburya agarophytonicola K14]|uniref:Fructosamine kinase family protein n=1 Tax=Waterburya agarophytonicola KI4 TaxID=2874699 RepID=A0A964BS25_9CYAN|nr:fructosamine kinase family protein [Waterburya agarophytonicola]MCC0177152.1 fructosamine kinase family protein [Waterburya agarophytonicola KI4]
MNNAQTWRQIASAITEATGQEFAIADTRSVSGGCINQGYRVGGNDAEYFVKLNQASLVEMFVAEAWGLKEMYATQTITVPQAICWGTAGDSSYIVLQWLNLARGSDESWRSMGRELAEMHQAGIGTSFGWERNNTIGSTPQINTPRENWADFFAEQRIGYQLKLAQRRGGNFPDRDTVVDAVRNQLADRQPEVSIVHGDLWSGNAGIAVDGCPVIFDPATYYGDRETDLAMTELFGGFPSAFYRGYNEVWQLDKGYQQRKSIYNLYHILNHFNLFGGGYGSQAKRIIQQII